MEIVIDHGGDLRSYAAHEGENVLDVLQRNGIDVPAPCGGNGKCGKCQVLIRDKTGLNYRLACCTEVTDGLEVFVERPRAMEVQESGVAESFPADTGEDGYGIAVDVGTTTVVAHLHQLSDGVRIATTSRANPQIIFGSDVISRISASVEGKLDLMVKSIQDAIADMRKLLCQTAQIDEAKVSMIVLAGNTTMEHIAAGLPPDTIGVNPFTPLSLFGDIHTIEKLGSVYFVPCIAGYVGGDITAGMLARGLDSGGTKLFLDLGTNGEMALAHEGRITCCATAAGPVFEGANVHFGMPARPGALSQVSFNTETGRLETTVLGDEAPIGICGTGIIDAVAVMAEYGVIEESGFLPDPEHATGPLASHVGKEESGNVFYLTEDHSLYITQADVRSLQLAKAAVCAGVRTMMTERNVSTDQIESLEIAGGFGRFLNLKSAARVGMFPAELLDRASSVGNTSGEGASALLISRAAQEKIDQIIETCDYIELSNSKTFNALYVTLMMFD